VRGFQVDSVHSILDPVLIAYILYLSDNLPLYKL
jgi:hypothetical protein